MQKPTEMIKYTAMRYNIMQGNKQVFIGIIAVMLTLCFTYSAYATVVETSLAVRDRLPASTLADMPSFIEDYRELGSKVSFDSIVPLYHIQ